MNTNIVTLTLDTSRLTADTLRELLIAVSQPMPVIEKRREEKLTPHQSVGKPVILLGDSVHAAKRKTEDFCHHCWFKSDYYHDARIPSIVPVQIRLCGTCKRLITGRALHKETTEEAQYAQHGLGGLQRLKKHSVYKVAVRYLARHEYVRDVFYRNLNDPVILNALLSFKKEPTNQLKIA